MASLRSESFSTNPLAPLFEYVPSIKYVDIISPLSLINHTKNINFYINLFHLDYYSFNFKNFIALIYEPKIT